MWIMDSGATDYFLSCAELAIGLFELEKPVVMGSMTGSISVTVGARVAIRVLVDGRCEVFEFNALYDKRFRANLIPLVQFEAEGGSVLMEGGRCFVKGANGLPLLQGTRVGATYFVDQPDMAPDNTFRALQASASALRGVSDAQLLQYWHRRLGHINLGCQAYGEVFDWPSAFWDYAFVQALFESEAGCQGCAKGWWPWCDQAW